MSELLNPNFPKGRGHTIEINRPIEPTTRNWGSNRGNRGNPRWWLRQIKSVTIIIAIMIIIINDPLIGKNPRRRGEINSTPMVMDRRRTDEIDLVNTLLAAMMVVMVGERRRRTLRGKRRRRSLLNDLRRRTILWCRRRCKLRRV